MEDVTTSGRQFHLQHLVGAGAFGEVYLAEQDSGAGFRRKVAIKLLHADIAEMSRDAGRRMRDEARILGRLSHRNIVTVLDLVKLGDRWAIIMDYVPGADLEEVLQALEVAESSFPAAAALETGAAVMNALDAAFQAEDGQGGHLGVIHRDIKPSNIRLTTDGEVKVLDFGVARVNMDTREAMTRATGWIGTERYMSPERILCEGDGPAGDVYAAAASVLELLLGQPLGRTPVLPDKHGPWIEEHLEACRATMKGSADEQIDAAMDWLRRGLHADPEQRPSAREMSDGLSGLARKLDGEGLEQFARRFMSEVDTLLERSPRPVEGVLSEQASSSAILGQVSGETLAERGGVSATFDPDALAHGAPEPTSTATSITTRQTVLLGGSAILLAGLGGLAAVVLGVVLYLNKAPEPEPEALPPAVAIDEPGDADAPPEPPPPTPVDAGSETEPTVEVAAPTPAPTKPAPVEQPPIAPVPDPDPPPVADGPRIEKAMVSLENASSITVRCGGVQNAGTASVRLRDFPSGPCTVTAVYLNQTYQTTATIDRPQTVSCSVQGDTLKCQ